MADYTTIDNPGLFFNTVLYTGNGTDDHAITGVNFQPDFVWIKTRSESNNHNLYDVIRGVNKPLKSNSTASEFTRTDALKSFDSDGFTLDDDATSDEVNKNTVTYASWNWLGANGTASNSDGSISTTVSTNQTAGCSIVSYTGTGSAGTIGHGLGTTPAMGIFKNRSAGSTHWRVWHQNLANDKILELSDTTAAHTPGTADFNISNNSSTVWGLSTNSQSNGSGNSMIAYIFAEKQGYSKFGGWTGNGQSSGPFIYTGFRPAFLSWKMTSSTENWYINDNKREPFNDDAMTVLYPNLSNADGALNDEIDLLANGFKINGTNSAHNTDGATYIYWAFAEHPFVTSGTKAAGTAR